MEVSAHSYKQGIFRGLICVLLTIAAVDSLQGYSPENSDSNSPNPQTQAVPSNSPEVDPGNIDKLLDMADKDISQLQQVNVSGHTGSQILDMQVNSVERQDKPISKTGAAVYVLTNEMIKRTGARNIPEALRYVPGLQVARINADTWAISIRGFNGQFADKLLVQIDGRAIFQPIDNGVYWDQQFVMLEDVDRIEIVRGSGGAIWGVNAVNGIINIITKSSKDTTGVYAEAGGGDQHQIFSSARVGGRDGDFTWRAWGTQNKENHGYLPDGTIPNDALSTGQGGFRTDWQADRDDLFTFQGDWLGGSSSTVEMPTTLDAANTLLRWNRTFSETSDQSVQVYYDYFNRAFTSFKNLPVNNNAKTFDFDYKYHINLNDRNDVVAGAGYRNYTTFENPDAYNPSACSFKIITYFVQDTITLRENLLYTTFGCKFAHDDFTNFEYQPCWKMVWTPNEKTSIWTSISRNVGIPAIEMRNLDALTQIGPWAYMHFLGNPDLVSEDDMCYEAGIRRQSTEKFYWDTSVYFNRYDNLIFTGPFVFIPPNLTTVMGNYGQADTYGFETTANYQVTESWILSGNYSLFKIVSKEMDLLERIAHYPINMANFRSGWNIGKNVTFDLMVRYVDSLDTLAHSYILGDMRLGWQPTKRMEVAVVGQNLFAGPHYEFPAMSFTPTETVPGWYGMMSYRY
jgi:iron complex outermembrane recepter protein